MADPPLILVVDDEQSYRDALSVALSVAQLVSTPGSMAATPRVETADITSRRDGSTMSSLPSRSP